MDGCVVLWPKFDERYGVLLLEHEDVPASHEQQRLAPGVLVLVPAALPFGMASRDVQLECLVEPAKIERDDEHVTGMLLEDDPPPRSVRRDALPLRTAAGREAVNLIVELQRA